MSIKIYKNQIGAAIISMCLLAYLMSPVSIVGFYFPLAMMCLWLLWCLVNHPRKVVKIFFKDKFFLAYIYPLFLFLYYLNGRTILSKVVISFMLVTICLLFFVYHDLDWKPLNAKLVEFIIVLLIIINFYTIFKLLLDYNISRMLAHAEYWRTLEPLEVPFIGGFYHIYSLCMLVVCAAKLFFNCNKSSIRLLYLLFIISSIITIVMSRYTYALLLTVLFLGFLLLEPFIKKKFWWLLPIVAILVFIVIIYRGEIMDILIRFVGSSSYVGRNIMNLKRFLTGGSVIIDSDAYKRIYVYMVSIQTWLKNFWTGIGYNGYRGYGKDGIGGHSEIFDSLAQYGFIGTAFFVFMLIFLTSLVIKRIDKRFYFLYIIIIVEYVCELVINPGFTLTQFTTVFLVIPCMLSIGSEERIRQ